MARRLSLSATDVAIAFAAKDGSIRLVERPSRFGGTTVAIEDAYGVIEVADDMSAALARVAGVAA
jgi:hypothetical protein